MKNKQIEDFGQKIGGARKDYYYNYKNGLDGVTPDEFANLSVTEQKEIATKANIWNKMNYQRLIDEGYNPIQVGWAKIIYDSLEASPSSNWYSKEYFNFITSIKNIVKKGLDMPFNEWAKKLDNSDLYREIEEARKDADYTKMKSRGSITKYKKGIRSDFNDIAKYLIDKNLFLTGYQQQKLQNDIYLVDGKDTQIEILPNGRCSVTLRNKNSHRMFYDDLFKDAKVGDYVVYSTLTRELYNDARRENNTELMDQIKKLCICQSEKDALAAYEAICVYNGKVIDESKTKKKTKDNPNKKPTKMKFNPKITMDYENRRNCEYQINKTIEGNDYLKTFNFKGGEFGNWLNQKERQNVLNCGYDSFLDLAYCLGITPQSISLGDKLNIAFGARGKGGAHAGAAHYEPMYNVINLTKMYGAGCVAHEWGHALDFYLKRNEMKDYVDDLYDKLRYKRETIIIKGAKSEDDFYERAESICKIKVEEMVENNFYGVNHEKIEQFVNQTTDIILRHFNPFPEQGETHIRAYNIDTDEIYKLEKELFEVNKISYSNIFPLTNIINNDMKEPYKDIEIYKSVPTQYYKDSLIFDQKFQKTSFGYWSDDKEMFARAFDQFVNDNLPFENKFLTSKEYLSYQPTPQGEERKLANELFKNLIKDTCEKGLIQKLDLGKEDPMKEFYSQYVYEYNHLPDELEIYNHEQVGLEL